MPLEWTQEEKAWEGYTEERHEKQNFMQLYNIWDVIKYLCSVVNGLRNVFVLRTKQKNEIKGRK